MEAYYMVPREPVELVTIAGVGAIPRTPIPAAR
jgi:hypothetical protein